MSMNSTKELLSVSEIASLLQTLPRVVRQWIRSGKLPTRTAPGELEPRVHKYDLIYFLEENGCALPKVWSTAQQCWCVGKFPPWNHPRIEKIAIDSLIELGYRLASQGQPRWLLVQRTSIAAVELQALAEHCKRSVIILVLPLGEPRRSYQGVANFILYEPLNIHKLINILEETYP